MQRREHRAGFTQHTYRNIIRMHTLRTLSIAVLLITACSGNEPAATPAPSPAAPVEAAEKAAPTPPPAPAPVPVTPVVVTPDAEGVVRLTANDQMRFSATRIEVKAGSPIKIELSNIGTLPKEAMGHNLIVLKPGVVPAAFAAKAINAKPTDYVPADSAAEVVGHTKLLGPGEKETLTLEGLAAGTYPFLCSFPGHVALMNGELVVQ
jgi:azurin